MKRLLILLLILSAGGFYIYKNYGYLGKSIQNYIPPKQIQVETGIEELSVPEGFVINYFAKEVEGARSIAVSDSGVVYVGTRAQGVVYALEDTNGDFVVDEVYTIASALNSPNGVVWHEGNLYVAEINRIIKFENIDASFKNNPTFSIVYDDLPTETHHGWKYLDIGPDSNLYVPIGAPCNICQTDGTPYATINRLNLDGSGFEIVARGIRNTVGFDWHPQTKELYFTDNGRDWLGDELPPDEFNKVENITEHFGYPHCHGKNVIDPDFNETGNCNEFKKPLVEFGPHVAALGVKFYDGKMFSEEFKNNAEHGSWNRTEPIGYRVTLVNTEENTYEVFADGWLNSDGDAWGRPVDIEMLKDGSLLVSDDLAGAIYRITYQK